MKSNNIFLLCVLVLVLMSSSLAAENKQGDVLLSIAMGYAAPQYEEPLNSELEEEGKGITRSRMTLGVNLEGGYWLSSKCAVTTGLLMMGDIITTTQEMASDQYYNSNIPSNYYLGLRAMPLGRHLTMGGRAGIAMLISSSGETQESAVQEPVDHPGFGFGAAAGWIFFPDSMFSFELGLSYDQWFMLDYSSGDIQMGIIKIYGKLLFNDLVK